MNSTEFRASLDFLRISQVELARILNVTSRAVNTWATQDRRVPGPIEAYLNLLVSLPADYTAKELYRAKSRSKGRE